MATNPFRTPTAMRETRIVQGSAKYPPKPSKATRLLEAYLWQDPVITTPALQEALEAIRKRYGVADQNDMNLVNEHITNYNALLRSIDADAEPFKVVKSGASVHEMVSQIYVVVGAMLESIRSCERSLRRMKEKEKKRKESGESESEEEDEGEEEEEKEEKAGTTEEAGEHTLENEEQTPEDLRNKTVSTSENIFTAERKLAYVKALADITAKVDSRLKPWAALSKTSVVPADVLSALNENLSSVDFYKKVLWINDKGEQRFRPQFLAAADPWIASTVQTINEQPKKADKKWQTNDYLATATAMKALAETRSLWARGSERRGKDWLVPLYNNDWDKIEAEIPLETLCGRIFTAWDYVVNTAQEIKNGKEFKEDFIAQLDNWSAGLLIADVTVEVALEFAHDDPTEQITLPGGKKVKSISLPQVYFVDVEALRKLNPDDVENFLEVPGEDFRRSIL